MTATLHVISGDKVQPSDIENKCREALAKVEKSAERMSKKLDRIIRTQESIQSLTSNKILGEYLDALSSADCSKDAEEIASSIEKITDMLAAQSIIALSEVQELVMDIKYQDKILMRSIADVMEEIVNKADCRKSAMYQLINQ